MGYNTEQNIRIFVTPNGDMESYFEVQNKATGKVIFPCIMASCFDYKLWNNNNNIIAARTAMHAYC